MFPFALPCFTPTAVPQVLPFFSVFFRPLLFRAFPLSFCFLSSASVLLPATQPYVLPFLFFPVSPHNCFPGAPSPLSLPRFPLSLQPDFSCLPSRFLYSASLMVSFRPSLLRSRSCSTGDPLSVSLFGSPPGPVPDFRFLSSTSVLASHYSASVSSFPFSSCFCLTVASSVLVSAFASSFFLVLSRLISHAFLPVSGTQLSVCFLSSFPASLPQLFHRCLPSAFAFGLFPSFSASFRPLSFSGSDYLAFCSSFPFSFRLRLSVAFPVLRSHFRSFGFPRSFPPNFLCGRSRFSVLGFLFVSFRSSLIHFPQLFLRCFPFSVFFRPLLFRAFPLSLCFLSSALVPPPATQLSVSSFPFSSCFCLTVAFSVLRFCFRFFGFPRSLLPDLSCIPSRFWYLAFCLFPFVLSCFTPTAVPQVIPF